MIEISKINKKKPYDSFIEFYNTALKNNQSNIEAIAISSFDNKKNIVDSRFVNLKYIIDENWHFFSNYKSSKASQFLNHPQVSLLIYWNTVNLQIRMKANIKKSEAKFSDSHFLKRSASKNALAISSRQSNKIISYEEVEMNYDNVLNSNSDLSIRPDYWGGYSFTPYYFEFWKGNKFRLNKRDVYEMIEGNWSHSILQP